MNNREAAMVALTLTFTQMFVTFLTVYDWSSVSTNPNAFILDLLKFAVATFFSIFIVMSGIAYSLFE